MDRVVAVKIIKPEWRNSASAIEHAKALARVGHHPSIVTVYGVEMVSIEGMAVEVPGIIMEWIDGEKFGTRLAGNRFSADEVTKICRGVISGVRQIHANGIPHGDLHWGNVILADGCTPKIIDIDVDPVGSFAQLSAIARDAAINKDIDYCRRLVFKAFEHSEFGVSKIAEVEVELNKAGSLDDLDSVVEKYS